MRTVGIITAVCISPNAGIPKYPQAQAQIRNGYGLVGDYHAGETRRSRLTGKQKPNDRQLTIVAEEAYDYLNAELGTSLKAGDFGENFTTRGLGDLSDIPDGSILKIDYGGGWIFLRVIEQNVPCKNLLPYHNLMVKKSMGRRGLIAVVEAGCGLNTIVRPENTIGVFSEGPIKENLGGWRLGVD